MTKMKWYEARKGFRVAYFTCIILSVMNSGRLIYTEDHYYPWPKVTICRGCENTIFAWQKYDRRSQGVSLNGNGTNYMINVSSSSLFHTKCDSVKPEPITVTVK